ncbi:hypothetical protein Rcas_0341 [Roseiflexus castenholzii DSM 13941]|uniref:HpcH/HpaI aldolase/citrate lyase domain-containing protein n=2 Tax=Roseiflexus castenholzii TaxID=120962 RepID=A7NG86_ROSCS|nr:hypothetical protein Rcas_0341 [Roseiflexus castenholzii DSM 13941]
MQCRMSLVETHVLSVEPVERVADCNATTANVADREVGAVQQAAAAQYGKTWGITAPSIDALMRYRELGAQIIPWGGDFALADVLKRRGRELAALDESA